MDGLPHIGRATEFFPLTIAQRGMWFAQRLSPGDAVFNLAEIVEINGPLDADIFYAALRRCAVDAEATRLQFVDGVDGPVQAINPEIGGIFPLRDVSAAADPWRAANAWMHAEFTAPHDALTDRLWCTGLFRAGADKYYWYHRSHHILIDGFAGGLLSRRVAELYAQILAGETPAPENPFGSLRDLVAEDHAYRAAPAFAAERAYWTNLFADKPNAVSLGNWRPTWGGGLLRQSIDLPHELVDRLRSVASAHKATLPQILIGAVVTFFYGMTGVEDLVLGLPVTARSSRALRRIPSMLANAVPFRMRMSPAMGIDELLRQVGRRVREALRYQRYRYEDLRRDLHLLGEGRHLFTTVINIEPFDYDLRFGHSSTTIHNLSNGSIEDLAIFAYERGGQGALRIDFDANPALYTSETLAAHQARLLRVLQWFAEDQAGSIGRIDMLQTGERATLAAFGQGPSPAQSAAPATLVDMLQAQVRATPFGLAVAQDGGNLTYRALNAHANRIAHALIARGIGAEHIVAVAVPRDAGLIAALLGVLKTGAAYLPVDSEYPAHRLAHMFAAAGVAATLTTTELAARLPKQAAPLLLDRLDLAALPASDPDRPIDPRQAAYVIFTSGSTGVPKGVVVPHAALANFMHALRDRLALTPQDRMLAVTTAGFDIAALELFLPLLSGASVAIAPRAAVLHAPTLARLVALGGITVMQATPSLWESLADEMPMLAGLRILTGGEALPAHTARLLQSVAAETINLYGPTETTIWSALHGLGEVSDAPPPIGRPIRDTHIHVLDAALRPVPIGATGEIYIAGAGLARGYIGQPALTGERFVPCPFGPPGARMYRTGDLGNWDEDGLLHCLGRTDEQVKLRGHRIELGDVRAALMALPDVAQAAAIVREDRPGDRRLIAYVIPAGAANGDAAAWREGLARALPSHMMPAAFVTLAALPLTPNGKLDRRALPPPDHTSRAARPPASQTEARLCVLFADTLGLRDVDTDSNFFELGGDSLLIARLVAKIRAEFSVELPLGKLFEASTIAALAALIDAARAEDAPDIVRIVPGKRPADIPLSLPQARLWLLNRLDSANPAYNIPLALRLTGRLDAAALEASLADIVARHETLRTLFPATADQPRQHILPIAQARPALARIDADPATLDRLLHEEAARGFDLAAALPLRMTLFSLGGDAHVLLIVVHHIAADGGSLAPLMRDFAEAYLARRSGHAPAWPPLAVHYADFAIWQATQLGREADPQSPLARQAAYWQRALAGLPTRIALATDRPAPRLASHEGGVVRTRIEPALQRRLVSLARDHRASLFMLLQAAFAALLTRMGAGTDIPVGSPVATRQDHGLEDLIGCFVNTVVVRTDTDGDPDFVTLLARVRQTCLDAYAHQDLPFERVVELVNPPRAAGHHPLFQVMLAFQAVNHVSFNLPETAIAVHAVRTGTAKFDLSLVVSEQRDAAGHHAGIELEFEYRLDLFDEPTVAALAARLLRLLEGVAEHPLRKLSRVDILSDAERLELLGAWSQG